MADWQDFINNHKWGNAFGIKGPLYDKVLGHRGTDLIVNAGETLLAWEELVCVGNGRHAIVGDWSNFKAKDGSYIGVAHLKLGTRPNVGAVLKAGAAIGQAAGRSDFHGTAWTGPHFHITRSDDKNNAAIGLGHLSDARPRIISYVSGQTPQAGSTAPPAPNQPGVPWAWNAPTADVQRRIQQGLKNRGRYKGQADGQFGINSIKGIQTTIHNVGYRGAVDGIPGPSTCYFIQVYAQRFGGYKGQLDSVLGPNSWLGFAKGINP